MLHTATTEAAARARFEAERTGQSGALPDEERRARTASFFAHNRNATAATQREANRIEAIGPAGREDERQAAHYATL